MIDDRFLSGSPTGNVTDMLREFHERAEPETESPLLDRMRTDDYWFAREVLGNDAVFPETLEGDFKELFEFVFSMGRTRRFGVCNSPRNSYKTTIIAAKILQLQAFDRNVRIAYFTNTFQNAALMSQALRSQLVGNEVLIATLGSFKPNPYPARAHTAWRDDEFFVSRRTTKAKEPTFTAAGVGVTKVGWHFDFIFIDDCVDKENSKTSESLKSTIDWGKLLMPLLDKRSRYGPGGCILDSGTRYAFGDMHGWLLGETDDDAHPEDIYDSLILQAVKDLELDADRRRILNEPKDFNFPFVLDKPRLQAELSADGSYWLYAQFQNEIRDPSAAIFRLSQFKLIPHYEAPHNLRYHVLTDYASGLRDVNDRTALWVVGLDWERKSFCVDFDLGRWGLTERIERSMGFVQKYNADSIAIEEGQGNEGVYEGLKHYRDRHRMRVRIEQIRGRSKESKFLRIQSLQPRFEGGRIFFVERDPTDRWGIKPEYMSIQKGKPTGEIVREFIRFPKATHDDIPDALSDLDKLDKRTGAYIFGGAPRYGLGGMPEYRAGVQFSMVNNRIQRAPLAQQTKDRGFWGEAAHALRRQR